MVTEQEDLLTVARDVIDKYREDLDDLDDLMKSTLKCEAFLV